MSPMNIKWTLFLITALAMVTPAIARAQASNFQSLDVHDLTGDLHIHQSLPLGCQDLDGSVPLLGGRIAIAPAEGIPVQGGRQFALTRATVSFVPFKTHVSCLGHTDDRDYTELSAQIPLAVSFV